MGIYAGDEAVQRIEGGRIVIEVVSGRHRRLLVGTPVGQARKAAALVGGDEEVAGSLAADALPLATFDRDQRPHGIVTREA